MLKHFVQNNDNGKSRFAVKIDGDVVKIKQIAGPAPMFDPNWLRCLLEQEGLMEKCDALNASRKYRWAVFAGSGMSGCRDYVLIYERDAEMGDYPRAARLHVSMYDKLNESVEMWLGDFAEIIRYAAEKEDYYRSEHQYETYEVPVLNPTLDWKSPPEFDNYSVFSFDEGIGDEELLGASTLAKIRISNEEEE